MFFAASVRRVERVIEIICNSSNKPIGRITREFDEKLNLVFLENPTKIVKALLQHGEVLKVPLRMKTEIIVAANKSLPDLSLSEFTQIPELLAQLPKYSAKVSLPEEDALFEAWMKKFVGRIDVELLPQVLLSVQKMHLVNPCKDVPIVRFIELIGREYSGQEVAYLLRAMSGLHASILAHPVVRNACISLFHKAANQADIGELVELASKLAVFPELTDWLVDLCVKSKPAHCGITGLIHSCIPSESFFAKWAKFAKWTEILEDCANLNHINHETGKRVLAHVDGSKWANTNKSIAGFAKLVSICEVENISKKVESKMIEKWILGNPLETAVLAGSVECGEEFFQAFVVPVLGKMNAAEISKLASNSETFGFISNHLEIVTDYKCVAALCVVGHPISDPLASRMRQLSKNASLNVLVNTQRILSKFGEIYLNEKFIKSEENLHAKLIREITRKIWNLVRNRPTSTSKRLA